MILAERIRKLSPQQRALLLQRLSDANDAAAERQIVAYVVARPGPPPNATELRDCLRSRLPEFMIPVHFVFLQSMPLNPNGKVDRHSLPAPRTEAAQAQPALASPRTDTEAKLIKIWIDVLRVENVGVEDNFFRLGGHSLLALQVMARVRDAFQADLPLKTLFESPTVAGLAEALRRFSEQPAKPIARIARRGQAAPFAPDHTFSNHENPRFPQDT
jgi:acyl carrier protein